MRIALDAMGSDNAPDVEVEGAVQASLRDDVHVVLVGDEALLTERLKAYPRRGQISVHHASEAIGMHESPVSAVRNKRDSSLMSAMRLAKEGEVAAVVIVVQSLVELFGMVAYVWVIHRYLFR